MTARGNPPDRAGLKILAGDLARLYPERDDGRLAVVDVALQCLYFLVGGELRTTYAVSTATRGTGNRRDSYQTPLGVFCIAEKYGDNAQPGAVFKGRRLTGELAGILTDPADRARSDFVVTRILRLSGLQPGFNQGGEVDTYERYIYIHGTPEENRIGTPASQGCVRMRNADIVELYEQIPVDTLVCIVPGTGARYVVPEPESESGERVQQQAADGLSEG
ncbi:L,D-transpeptidase [Acidihalobacter ferrooxydans]|uniref:L,D-TPase catalytic domain-containing protein n=1 Tax=Acidihalobacter ferrooxydans TaxID=1765967 RepID=A0A1P8UGI1_9GAMM|nr:L,D-transpeptidase [Acidihalobacter ferrooxydans]APZ42953.1 hypothetical protein BW247_07485 [Acidihalobacter ferrooxydans]